MLIAADGAQAFHNRLISGLGGSFWKKADLQSVPLLLRHGGSLRSLDIENTWEQSASEKLGRKSMALFLAGQPGWVCAQTRELPALQALLCHRVCYVLHPLCTLCPLQGKCRKGRRCCKRVEVPKQTRAVPQHVNCNRSTWSLEK